MKRTLKQKKAAKKNIKKARQKWKKMSKKARAKTMPGGKGRIKNR